MTASRTFKDLIVWQKAHQLVLDTYRFTAKFPKEEMYSLTSQLRRAIISVPANITEGFYKRGIADKRRFYNIAQGSLEEAHYYFLLAVELGYGDSKKLLIQVDEVGRLLQSYSDSLLTTKF